MKHFQIPELQAKLKHARALAADPSTTPHERESARRAAIRIEARLKEREGTGARSFDWSAWAEGLANSVRRESRTFDADFDDAIRKMRARRENPAYRRAY